MPRKRRKDTDVVEDDGIVQLKAELKKLRELCRAHGEQGHLLEQDSDGRTLYARIQYLVLGLMKLDDGEVLYAQTREQFSDKEWNEIREHWEETRARALEGHEQTVTWKGAAHSPGSSTEGPPVSEGAGTAAPTLPGGDPDSGWAQPRSPLIEKAEYDDDIPF